MSRPPIGVVLAALILASASTPSSQSQEPRFRGGANLVRLDVYASIDGVAVTDLTAQDFDVFEDNAPQTVSSFEFVRARGVAPDSARVEPSTVAESRSRAAQPDARLFVLFLDTLHVHLAGSFHAQSPMAALLDRVIGEDDLVGVMTPDITARNMTFSPRTSSVRELLRSNWAWGERQRLSPTDPREIEILDCYAGLGSAAAGIAEAMIARRREAKVLGAIDDLVRHLEGLREERTFVLLLTEGWLTPGPDPQLGRALALPGGGRLSPGGPDGIAVVGGKPTFADRVGGGGMASCERERSLLANEDLAGEFDLLVRRANRANVSFYPIDARGLVAFDTDLGPGAVMSPSADASGLANRQSALRRLAGETDGEVVLNTNLAKAAPKLLTDVGSYYLLGYVSTNPKLDGRYRRLTVKVKRPGVDLRARPGYLAPTAAEVSVAQVPEKSATQASVERALARLPGTRVATQVYASAAGGPGVLHLTFEVDRAVAALPEWSQGASARIEIASADGVGAKAVETVRLEPGARVHALRHPASEPLPPGRYQVRVLVTPDGGRVPLAASADATIPSPAALMGTASVALRRGPGTGRAFLPTADPRFRRTERVMLETSLLASDVTVSARLLNRQGQLVEVPVALSERTDEPSRPRVSVAEIALAPLAPADYVVELTAVRGDVTERIGIPLRIVP